MLAVALWFYPLHSAPRPKEGYQMKATHNFFGKVMLFSGLLVLGFIFADKVGTSFPLWVKNYTFAIFGVALTIFAFTFKRWRDDDTQ
jgi:uncharacterized membrane protein YhaH (DUF805 family)